MEVLDTTEICGDGALDPTPIRFDEAVKAPGVYRTFPRHLPFKPTRRGPGLVVTTDAVLYVNDGYVTDVAELNYAPDHPFYRTSLPLPDRIVLHKP